MPRLLGPDEVAGVVRLEGEWYYLLALLPEWILDDPSHEPRGREHTVPGTFRGDAWVITPSSGRRFLEVLAERIVGAEELGSAIAVHGDRTRPEVFVDFDRARFVSWFFDIAIEERAGAGWVASYEDPLPLLPPWLASLWAAPSG